MFKSKSTKPTNEYLGIFNTPQDDDNDSDFEAELLALNSANGNNYPKKSVKPKVVNDVDFNNMVAQSLKDTYSSEDDLSDNEDDPALLKELQDITGEGEEGAVEESTVLENVSPDNDTSTETMAILEQRIAMYELAEKNAKTAGDVSKSRRFSRGLKTLNDLLKQAKAGKTINTDDIPPEVSTKLTDSTKEAQEPEAKATRPAPPVPATLDFEKPTEPKEELVILSPTTTIDPEILKATTQHNNPIIRTLNERLSEYKVAALKAKKDGDMDSALQFIKVVKQFNVVINMALNGETVDLSDMPPPPDQFKAFLDSLSTQPEPNDSEVEQKETVTTVQNTTVSLLEALNERLSTYIKAEEAAKTEGNSGKMRRLGRIIKQYEDAIKLHKAGKTINKEELPTPPGFGPLPDEGLI